MYRAESIFDEAVELGVKGYLLKDSAAPEILGAIRHVSRGEYYFSPSLTAHVVLAGRSADPLEAQRAGLHRLSPTERHVLRLLGDSRSSREIAAAMNVSVRTVEHHRYNICAKLGLSGTY